MSTGLFRFSGKRLLFCLLALVGFALFLCGQIFDPPLVNLAREKIFDTYQRLSPRPLPADIERSVVIVAADEESLVEFGAWPWSRSLLAEITDGLREMGAKVVVYDVLFRNRVLLMRTSGLPSRYSRFPLLPVWARFGAT